jgi:hypothetical protein
LISFKEMVAEDWKDHSGIEFDSIGYASARNTENKTKLETIVRSLSTTRDYAWHILIKKSCERIFQRNTLCYH